MTPDSMLPREFLLTRSRSITRMMRDANHLSALEFTKRYRTGPREARAMISRFREICCLPEEQEEAARLVRRLACVVLDEGPNNPPILDAAAHEKRPPGL